jgi:hypothetical protein
MWTQCVSHQVCQVERDAEVSHSMRFHLLSNPWVPAALSGSTYHPPLAHSSQPLLLRCNCQVFPSSYCSILLRQAFRVVRASPSQWPIPCPVSCEYMVACSLCPLRQWSISATTGWIYCQKDFCDGDWFCRAASRMPWWQIGHSIYSFSCPNRSKYLTQFVGLGAFFGLLFMCHHVTWLESTSSHYRAAISRDVLSVPMKVVCVKQICQSVLLCHGRMSWWFVMSWDGVTYSYPRCGSCRAEQSQATAGTFPSHFIFFNLRPPAWQ